MLTAFCAMFLSVIGAGWGGLFGLAVFEHAAERDADWTAPLARGAFSGAAWGAFIGLLAGLVFESIR
jgi:hypothetical protein